jgi:hypothetical protein
MQLFYETDHENSGFSLKAIETGNSAAFPMRSFPSLTYISCSLFCTIPICILAFNILNVLLHR